MSLFLFFGFFGVFFPIICIKSFSYCDGWKPQSRGDWRSLQTVNGVEIYGTNKHDDGPF